MQDNTSDSSLKNSWAAYGPGNSNRLEIGKKIFRLYFGEIHSFAPDFISEGSFRPEEFFEILF